MNESVESALYLIHGSDSHLVSEEIDSVRQRLLDGRDPEMVVSEFEGEEAITQMLDAARIPTFVGGRRILISRLKAINSADADALLDYLENPSPDAVLLVSTGGRVPRDLMSALKKSDSFISAAAPAPHRRVEWVMERARGRGINLTADAARHVAEVFGGQVTALGPFFEQLRVAYPDEARLDLEEVASAASGPRKGAAWDLTDSIDAGATESALSYLAGALSEGSHPLQILALLAGYYRRLALVAGRRLTSEEAAKELGIRAFPAEKAMAQAARLGEKKIRRAISLIARADLDLKGASAQEPVMILEMLVIRLSALRASKTQIS